MRNLKTKIDSLEDGIKQKIDKPKEEPESELIDLNDPVKEALYAQKQIQDKLNGIK